MINKLFVAQQSRSRFARMSLFLDLIHALPKPVRILDIGGLPKFWSSTEDVNVTCVNLLPFDGTLQMDACDLKFPDNSFDVAFSNSVIEHVGDWSRQAQMASEVQRVGERYWVQTPNFWFPVEPHIALPFVQYLPMSWRVLLVKFYGGRMGKNQRAQDEMRRIRLLTEKEMRQLFPGANLWKERLFGLCKSFVAYRLEKML